MNFGVLGYSSFQGLELLKRRVLDLQPDVVLIGFGMNDSEVAGYRDKDVGQRRGARLARPREGGRRRGASLYGLLKYFALALRFHPQTMGDFLKADAKTESAKGNEAVNYDDIEPWTRVSPHDYDRNIREMVTLARGRGRPRRAARQRAVAREPVPARAGRHRARRAHAARGQPADHRGRTDADRAGDGNALSPRARRQRRTRRGVRARRRRPSPVVFRVYRGRVSACPQRLSIVGNHPSLGDLVPNTIALHDDGTDGDERAGDHVWSLRAEFPAGTRLKYVYTNSGRRGSGKGSMCRTCANCR